MPVKGTYNLLQISISVKNFKSCFLGVLEKMSEKYLHQIDLYWSVAGNGR